MRIGVLGAGQLGRMLGLAARPLDVDCRFYDTVPGAPAAAVGALTVGRWDDADALARWAEGLDVVTLEFENVPAEAVRRLAAHVPVYPPPVALETAQDRLPEKECFRRGGIPTAPFAAASGPAELSAALATSGVPAVLKTRRMGYDGKGQRVLRDAGEAADAWSALGAPLIAEGLVRFARELSVIAVRGRGGETGVYPLVENVHREGILRSSRAPAPRADALAGQAEAHVEFLLRELDYVGVLAVEFFDVDGQLVANEMAPRVHNTGHWTIEGAETSQFENHVRAVCGLPLGSTRARGPSAMLNLIGDIPSTEAVLAVPGAHLHLYGKAPRARRKVGHVTVAASDDAELEARLSALRRAVPSVF
jgi:5-(carboxyamino)imidazole ribonucleotide synthase